MQRYITIGCLTKLKAFMRKLSCIFFTSIILFSCDPKPEGIPMPMEKYVPVYASAAEVQKISVEPQKPTVNAGKIYAYGNYIFQNDLFSGIHIIENSEKDNPVKVAFLKLPLNSEIAIKGNYLYANNYTDLVVFDVTNPASPQFVKRVAGVFPPANQEFPPYTNVYFKCVDKSKGIVVRWEKQDIPTPNCRR
jgi:hypothetical protein